MKLSTKLPLAFLTVLVLMAAGALFGIFELNQSLDKYGTVVKASSDNQLAFEELAFVFKVQVQEWKDTLLRGKNPKDLDKHWTAFTEREAEVREKVAALRAALPDGKSRTLLESFSTEHEKLGGEYRTGLAAFKAAGFDPSVGDTAVRGKDREPVKLLSEAGTQITADRAQISAAAAGDGKRAITISLFAMAAASLAGLGCGIHISRGVTRQLGGDPAVATHLAQRVAQGDLRMQLRGTDHHADSLLAQLDRMQESLVRVVSRVRQNAESVAVASSQIAQGNTDLSGRTEEQASALEQTAASMEQLGSNVRSNAENAHKASELAKDSSALVARGGDVVGRVVETMKDINDSSKRIADIITVIDGIAFQTNILALNAAVEAARAGEQGRGFAVVAGEVRTLAQRSADASKEIRNLIAASVERVEKGTALVDEAGATMTQIVGSIRNVTQILSEISLASAEQSAGVAQITEAVSQMDNVTQQNAALVEQSAAAADALRMQSQQLLNEVAIFRLEAAASQGEPEREGEVAAA
jgi:methyl-accepting chemotaxis protein-1 (serine sensor receptor)